MGYGVQRSRDVGAVSSYGRYSPVAAFASASFGPWANFNARFMLRPAEEGLTICKDPMTAGVSSYAHSLCIRILDGEPETSFVHSSLT